MASTRRRGPLQLIAFSVVVCLLTHVEEARSHDNNEQLRQLSAESAETANMYGLGTPGYAAIKPASDLTEGGTPTQEDDKPPPTSTSSPIGDGSATEKLKMLDKEVAADLSKQVANSNGKPDEESPSATSPATQFATEPTAGLEHANADESVNEPAVVAEAPPSETTTKGQAIVVDGAAKEIEQIDCKDPEPVKETLNNNGGKAKPSGDGSETEKLREMDTEVEAEARSNTTAAATGTPEVAPPELGSTRAKAKCVAKGDAAKPKQEDAVTAEEEEENLEDRERRARSFIMGAWSKALRDIVHENFAYHDISHAFLFAEHVTKYTDDLAMKVLGFIGGLYHNAALPETTTRDHYNLLCNVENKAGFIAASPQRQLAVQLKSKGKEVHPDPTKGHEVLSACRALQWLKEVSKSPSREQVVTDIQGVITPERIHWLVAAMAHTNVRYIHEGSHPLRILYSRSMAIKKDISKVLGATGSSIQLSGGPMECDALPLEEWVPGMTNYWDAIYNDEESDTAILGQADMNNAFHNAVFLHYGEERGVCAVASELNEVMAYQGLITHNPTIGSSYELVLRHLYGMRDPEIQKLKKSTSAVGIDGKATPWVLYDDFTVILIAYYHDQVSNVGNWVHFHNPVAKKHSTMIDTMNRVKKDNEKALQATRDKMIKIVFPQITDDQIRAWEVLHSKEPYSPERLEELRDSPDRLKAYKDSHDMKNKKAIIERLTIFEKTMVSFRYPQESCEGNSEEEACDVGPHPITRDDYLRLLTEEWSIGGSNAVQSKGPTCSFQRVPVVMEMSRDSKEEMSVWSGRLSQNPIVLPPELSPFSEETSVCKVSTQKQTTAPEHTTAKDKGGTAASTHLRKEPVAQT